MMSEQPETAYDEKPKRKKRRRSSYETDDGCAYAVFDGCYFLSFMGDMDGCGDFDGCLNLDGLDGCADIGGCLDGCSFSVIAVFIVVVGMLIVIF